MDNVFFNFFQMCYTNKWITIDTLKQAVVRGRITTVEYKQITNIDYVA